MRILITGGAGFVGSSLALCFKEDNPKSHIVVFDNLKRRGSELNLARFKKHSIDFIHGDIRQPADLADIQGDFDVFIEASAEPSVLAGISGSPNYVLQTNLAGTLHCLEFARQHTGCFLFLSTSRVYSMKPLRELSLTENATRLTISEQQGFPGITSRGISESFPTNLPRSLYGASKLASELVVQEYADTYKLKAVINRCGVIAGPGQFGKVDQGVFTMWVANHVYGLPLKYIGFGGTGKQVRDLLHPNDLYALLKKQLARVDECSGEIFNVGGGVEGSTSLLELTQLCQKASGRSVTIGAVPETTPVDIPLYISDSQKVMDRFDWQPQRNVEEIVRNIFTWLQQNKDELRQIFS